MTYARADVARVIESGISMTTHLRRYRTLCATEASRRQPLPVSDGLDLENARRQDDGYERGESAGTAALFAGLFLGAGSTALMFWLGMLVF